MAATTQHESLLQALERVPDPRSRRGRRYRLASVLGLAVCAMAAGARSLYAMAQWGREHRELVCGALGMAGGRTPDVATLHRVLRRLDVEAFERVLGRWFRAQGLQEAEGIAADGKTLRGIHGEELPGVHLVAAYAHESGMVLTQQAAEGPGQELAAAKRVLKRLDLRGHIVTGDALLAQRGVCAGIVKKRGTTCCG